MRGEFAEAPTLPASSCCSVRVYCIRTNRRRAISEICELEAAPGKRRKPGRLKRKIRIADDFDAPLPDELLKRFNKGPIFP